MIQVARGKGAKYGAGMDHPTGRFKMPTLRFLSPFRGALLVSPFSGKQRDVALGAAGFCERIAVSRPVGPRLGASQGAAERRRAHA